MAFDITSDIGTGSDQELLDLTRASIALVTKYGKTRGTNGRLLEMSDLPALYEAMSRLEARISAATSSGSTTNYAIFKRAR